MPHIPLEAQPAWVPGACTLPTADRPLRSAEFDDLFRSSVLAVRRVGVLRLQLELRADATTAVRAAGLAAREAGCCSFFTFVLTIGAGQVTLEVGVPEPYVDVLDALAARAESSCGVGEGESSEALGGGR